LAGDQKGDRFERIIGQRLAAGRTTGDAHCPDASIIAAYRDRSLSPDERAQCERHLAQCARCGGVLAALARVDDAVEAGGIASMRAAREDGRGGWRLRGALSLAAFGAAAAILMVVALRTFTTHPGLSNSARRSDLRDRQTQALAANAPTVSASRMGNNALGGSNSLMAMNEAARAKPEPASPRKSYDDAKVPAPSKAAGSLAREHARTRLRDEQKKRDELKEKEGRTLEADKQKAETAGAPIGAVASAEAPAAAAPAPAPPAANEPAVGAGAGAAGNIAAPAATATLGVAAQTFAATGVPAESSSTASRSGAGAALGAGTGPIVGNGSALSSMQAGRLGPMPRANAIVVEGPDHSAVWMVGAHGAISRYSPATGWVSQISGVTTDLTGGSAPSAATCWIVGRGGTILRTIDGEHWTRIVAPVGEDLTGVVASSATEATISAASGRRFATTDGGATWRPLQ
jgi:hypothetical protein